MAASSAIGVWRAVTDASDFDGFHRGAVTLWTTGALSAEHAVYRYPPTFQALLLPFGLLPLWAAAVVWQALNALCLVALPRRFERLSGAPPAEQWPAWALAAPFIFSNLVLGQSGGILVFLAAAGLVWMKERRPALGAVLLALGGWIKVMPAVLLAIPLVLRRRQEAAAGVLLSLALVGGLTVLVAGPRGTAKGFTAWWNGVRKTDTPWQAVQAGRSLRYNNQGLAVTLARTFCPVDGKSVRGAVRLASFPFGFAWTLYGMIAAGMAAAWCACAWKARRLPPDRAWAGMAALTSVVMLVASPLVWTHYFIWTIFPALFLAKRRRLLGGLAVLSLLALAVRSARGLGFHMMMALLLFALAARELLSAPEEGQP